jgi:hypothetical protein
MLASPLALLLTLALAAGLPIAQTTTATATTNANPSETAAQFYLRFRDAALSAKTIDEVTRFWSAGLMDGFNLTREVNKPTTLETVKRRAGMFTDLKVTGETPTPDGVTLSLEGIGPDKTPMTGSVDIVRENGAWKLAGQEQWTPKGLTAFLFHPRSARAR